MTLRDIQGGLQAEDMQLREHRALRLGKHQGAEVPAGVEALQGFFERRTGGLCWLVARFFPLADALERPFHRLEVRER